MTVMMLKVMVMTMNGYQSNKIVTMLDPVKNKCQATHT